MAGGLQKKRAQLGEEQKETRLFHGQPEQDVQRWHHWNCHCCHCQHHLYPGNDAKRKGQNVIYHKKGFVQNGKEVQWTIFKFWEWDVTLCDKDIIISGYIRTRFSYFSKITKNHDFSVLIVACSWSGQIEPTLNVFSKLFLNSFRWSTSGICGILFSRDRTLRAQK